MHIGSHQVQAHGAVEHRHDQEAHTDLDKATPEAHGHHQQMPPDQLCAGRPVVARALRCALVQVHDQHYSEHHQGQDAVEPDAVESGTQQGASHRPRDCAGGQAEAQPEIAEAPAEKCGDGAQVLGQDGNAIGAVCHRTRQAHENQHRHAQQRASPGHDIEEARDNTYRREHCRLP